MTSTDSARSPALADQPIVAITGASGYLGSVLVAAFAAAGFSVRRLVRTPVPGSSDQPFDLNSATPPESLDGVDVLVHCAYDLSLTRRSDIWQTNVFGTTALLNSAVSAGVRRTIVLSSMSAYGGTRQLYGRAKLDTEIAALSRGMCAIRPGLVYGPGWGGMAGTLRRLAGLPVLPDFGSRAHQFTVREDDFAAAVLALALRKIRRPSPWVWLIPIRSPFPSSWLASQPPRASPGPVTSRFRRWPFTGHYGPLNYFLFNYRFELTLSSGSSDRRRMCRILRSSRGSESHCSRSSPLVPRLRRLTLSGLLGGRREHLWSGRRRASLTWCWAGE